MTSIVHANPRKLLVSMGMSWAVVPEAFHFPGANFDEVYVITSDGPAVEAGIAAVRDYFRNRNGVRLTVMRVAGFVDLRDERDHRLFEEVVFRWVWRHRVDGPLTVCLAGGFKTMSTVLQTAAEVFGADEVFHVIADPAVNSAEAVDRAVEEGAISYIPLGAQPGWPQGDFLEPQFYELDETRLDGDDLVRIAPAVSGSERDGALSGAIARIRARSMNVISAWPKLGELPFHQLATWSARDLGWLSEPLQPETDRAWVAKLPKVELHCHLGGFATHGDLLDAVQRAADRPDVLEKKGSPPLPGGWPFPSAPIGLERYCTLGDANGSALLTDPGCLRRQCELLFDHLLDQQVHLAEIRCSPANYAADGRSAWKVLEEIKTTFDACTKANGAPLKVNLIIIATRRDGGDFRSDIARHLSLAVTAAEHWRYDAGCRVVGVDLAGFEDPTTRAELFRADFTAVHRCGLALTVHAGENDDAEAIWQAVFSLNARRLGHALELGKSGQLLRSVAARGITIEMCPYANLQIKGFPLDARAGVSNDYPLASYLAAGASVCLNTDNIGISQASLTDNYLLAARLCPGFTRMDLLRCLRHAADGTFLESPERGKLIAKLGKAISSPP